MTTATADVETPKQSAARGPELADLARRLAFLAPLLALIVLQRVFFPAPLGVVVNGALFGGRIALIALGIALVYRANRIVNFAQGDLGAVPATLAVMLVVAWNWNYWIGLVVGLAAALVLGVLVESLIIRRFFAAPRLVLTVATIGLAQLLAGAGLFLPRAFGDQTFGTRLEPPFEANFEIGGTNFNANDVLTMIVVPACLVALALFLQRSRVGVAIVGSAERADRAFTLGIPVKRLHTVVWVVAAVLAFLGMFLRAGAVGLPIGEVLPPTFLVQALAAAVFGRFERFTSIAAAAIGRRTTTPSCSGSCWPACCSPGAAAPPPASTPTPRPPGRPRARSVPSPRSCGGCPRSWGRGRRWASWWGRSCSRCRPGCRPAG